MIFHLIPQHRKFHLSLFLFFFSFLFPLISSAPSSTTSFGPYHEVLPTPQPVNLGLYIRRFAKIPDYPGDASIPRGPSKIVGMTSWRNSLFVCSSVSGGLIHRVNAFGVVSLWMDVSSVLRKYGRRMTVRDKFHGGVRSIAFHPNGRQFYISVIEDRLKAESSYRYLSRPKKMTYADSVLLEFTISTDTGLPNPNSLREVLRVGLNHVDHPIKQIVFKGLLLYISHGDGSVHSTLLGSGQNGNDALGKILRINPLQGPNGEPYTIPLTNPYRNVKGFLPELFAIGFRNPHTMCFARAKPYELFVGDAGRDNVEEINIVRGEGGENYGWELREGPFVHLFKGGGLKYGISSLPKNDKSFGFTYPSVALGHYGRAGIGFDEAKQAIAGGCPVDNGSELNGIYFFSNFPSDGNIYFSYTNEMRSVKTKGAPEELQSAKMYHPIIWFDADGTGTYKTKVRNIRDIIQYDLTKGSFGKRADTRFGRGSNGAIYLSSKQNGMIYVIQNTVPGFVSRNRNNVGGDGGDGGSEQGEGEEDATETVLPTNTTVV